MSSHKKCVAEAVISVRGQGEYSSPRQAASIGCRYFRVLQDSLRRVLSYIVLFEIRTLHVCTNVTGAR